MATRKVLRVEDVKINNRNKILAMIYRTGKNGISQSVVANETGLKGASVFRIFTELEKDGLIQLIDEAPEITVLKGRKPSLFTVNPNALYVVAAEITCTGIDLSFFNFMTDTLASASYEFTHEDIDDITNMIIKFTEDNIVALNLPREKVVGISVSLPGVVDINSGIILKYERIKGCVDYPMADKLKNALGLNTIICNSTATNAYYEYNTNKYGSSVFTILLRHGINGAFINKGKIFLDSNGYSLDFEHLQVSFEGGPKCSCGSEGCLQSYIFNIEDEYNEKILLDLEKYLSTDLARLDFILDKIVYYLAVLIRGFDKIMNPSSFLILTKDKKIGEILRNKLKKVMDEKVSTYSKDLQKPFYSSTYDTVNCQKASVVVLLKQFFDPETAIYS